MNFKNEIHAFLVTLEIYDYQRIETTLISF